MSAPALAVPAAAPSLPLSLSELVWRAGHMGRASVAVTSTGHAALDRELPDGGWPHRGLIELLLQQEGIGEMRLLQPALQALGTRRIALLQPPHLPQIAAWRAWGFRPEQLLWIRTAQRATRTRCGALNRFCVTAVAVRCCSGRTPFGMNRCVAYNWRRKPQTCCAGYCVHWLPQPKRHQRLYVSACTPWPAAFDLIYANGADHSAQRHWTCNGLTVSVSLTDQSSG